MIKTFVKHQIYDFCIDIFFNRIKSNFNGNAFGKIPKVGEFYSRIVHKFDDEEYHRCVITGVEKRRNSSNKDYYVITIKYEWCSGIVFGDDERMREEIERNFESLLEETEVSEDGFLYDENGSEKVYREWMDNNEIDSAQFGGGMSINHNFFRFYK